MSINMTPETTTKNNKTQNHHTTRSGLPPNPILSHFTSVPPHLTLGTTCTPPHRHHRNNTDLGILERERRDNPHEATRSPAPPRWALMLRALPLPLFAVILLSTTPSATHIGDMALSHHLVTFEPVPPSPMRWA